MYCQPPKTDYPENRWLTFAEAAGHALVQACRDPEAPDHTRATPIGVIAARIWPGHGWAERDVEQVMRLLCAVVGCVGEGASGTEAALPRFRLHTFFKSPEGLYASVVPPSQRHGSEDTRWQGPLSLNLAGRRLEQVGDGGALHQRGSLSCCTANAAAKPFWVVFEARNHDGQGRGCGGGTAPS